MGKWQTGYPGSSSNIAMEKKKNIYSHMIFPLKCPLRGDFPFHVWLFEVSPKMPYKPLFCASSWRPYANSSSLCNSALLLFDHTCIAPIGSWSENRVITPFHPWLIHHFQTQMEIEKKNLVLPTPSPIVSGQPLAPSGRRSYTSADRRRAGPPRAEPGAKSWSEQLNWGVSLS
jgi:hypothetical protein